MPILSLPVALLALALAAGAIALAGPRMVRVADRLADVTGLGEAFVGAVLVGAATSLPDILATALPAVRGFAELAVGNALGGVLGQTAFLAIADLTYRRANLEHAAASLPNLVQGTLLITLLGGVMVLFTAPEGAVLGVHPGSLVLLVVYGYGLRLVTETSQAPMWRAVETEETTLDVPDEPVSDDGAPARLWGAFAGLAAVLAGAGITLAVAGESLVSQAGWNEAAVGVFLTGVGSSLAELVVSIAAIRAGALTLAVGNVIGGNTFDTLLVVVADIAYRDGSVYAAVGSSAPLVTALALVATAVITLGLLRRERHGVGNIGVESVVVLLLYVGAIALVV
ncbi:sodium:calcium antiporter [Egicoccus halophilus]|uniref:Cation transporter n=1 Tax=Egicoccus halophilus TaxID=1670830 RepID=A0A8J3A9F2_9ACTN|nr:sodium:calcium antiporter [Egicoccus halophilus]GGI07676.1 cation transporter [Egicoccus halophilus]